MIRGSANRIELYFTRLAPLSNPIDDALKTVRFLDRDQLRRMIENGLPSFTVLCEFRIPPRRNNVLYVLRRSVEF